MAMDFDSQLIESVEVRRNRLTAALLFGVNPTERQWKSRTNTFIFGLVTAALISAFCVALSFVISILSNWIAEREEREQQQEEMQREQEQMERERELQEQQEQSQSHGQVGSPVASPSDTTILSTLTVQQLTLGRS